MTNQKKNIITPADDTYQYFSEAICNLLENANITAEVGEGSVYNGDNATFSGNFTTDEKGEAIITFRCPEIKESGELVFRISADYSDYEPNSVTASLSYVYLQPKMAIELSISPESATTDDEIYITITVTDYNTGEPLANVSVALIYDEPNATISPPTGITDADGKFSATMIVSDIGKESETVRIAATANATGYAGVMQTKDLIVSRAESAPNISFIGVMAVVGIAAIMVMARKRE